MQHRNTVTVENYVESCMAYPVAQLRMTLSEAEGQFAVLNLCNAHNSENIVCFKLTTASLHINWKVQRMWLVI